MLGNVCVMVGHDAEHDAECDAERKNEKKFNFFKKFNF